MLIQKPLNIAICLNAPTVNRALEQKEMLISLESDFNIEWDIRAERIEGNMLSYSQMINEAVLATEAEFMIFLNPAAIPKPEDVHTIINDLCSGYVLSSIVAFGFYGITKEVFRRIGMMDERFLGGQFEDTDFLVRLKDNNLAVNWRYISEQYPHWGHNTAAAPVVDSQFRGITQTIFPIKWFKKDNTLYRTDLFLQEKKGPKWFLKNKRHDIYSSWKPWKDSKYTDSEKFRTFIQVNNLDIANSIAKSSSKRVNGTLNILSRASNKVGSCPMYKKYPVENYDSKPENNLILFNFSCDVETLLTIVILDEHGNQISIYKKIYSGLFNIDDFNVDKCDIRVFHNGRIILHHNNFSMLGEEQSYTIGLNVYEFDAK